ncbi:MAG: nucleotidyltransferase domain-containing protein [Oscillibacter sp.]|nr:nucleotidyltransferase domain-containing protein [Oscillibacter sp.]
MLADTGIKAQVQEEICRFAEKYQLERVVLFGSRARGDYHRASDIDLAVWGGSIPQFAVDVDEDTSTLLKYDVVDMNRDVSEELRNSIQREGRVLYEKV